LIQKLSVVRGSRHWQDPRDSFSEVVVIHLANCLLMSV